MKRLAQLRQLACCRCHAPPPSQACHANWGEFGKGLGIKAGDEYTLPLCHTCHRWLDEYKEMDKEQAKAWFMERLEFVNKVLNEQTEQTAF